MTDDQKRILIDLIGSAPSMIAVLEAVHSLGLTECWTAAGFVRNRVWDHLQGHVEPTPPNDIDVVYFDPDDLRKTTEKRLENRLHQRLPGLPWSVKNQARMAGVNGDPPYRSTAHALEHWCETPTPIGVRLDAEGRLDIIAPLGLDDLFALIARPTPFASGHPAKLRQYRERMAKKNWPRLWPGIRVLDL